jgi:hypothetical protein
VLATRDGMAIRFHESDVREMGRATTGVRGIRLRPGDEVVGMVVVRKEVAEQATVLVATEYGRGKRTLVEEYRFQGRGGQGVINFRVNEQSGKVIAIKNVLPGDELMLITRAGVITRQRINEIRVIGRNTQGVRLMTLDEGDALVDVARVVPEDEEDAVLAEGTSEGREGAPEGAEGRIGDGAGHGTEAGAARDDATSDADAGGALSASDALQSVEPESGDLEPGGPESGEPESGEPESGGPESAEDDEEEPEADDEERPGE